MNILELKRKLLELNAKDKRLSLEKDLIILFIELAVGGVLMYLFQPWLMYLLIVVGVVALLQIVCLIKDQKDKNKRVNRIERFIDKIKAGDRAIDLEEYSISKINIPLPFDRLRLFTTDYISVSFDTNPSKYYTFPIEKELVESIREMLIEIGKNAVSVAKNEFLNNLPTNEAKDDRISLKNVDEFTDFLDRDLQFTINDMEHRRQTSPAMRFIASLLLLVVSAGWLYYMYILLFDERADLLSSPYEMLLVVGVLFGIFYSTYLLYFRNEYEDTIATIENSKKNVSAFKNKILQQVIRFMNPQAGYSMSGYIDQDLVMQSGLFKNKEYKIRGNDLIIGKYNGVRFQSCDLLITHRTLFTSPSQLPDVVFQGQFFMSRLSQALPTPIYLVQRKARSLSYGMSNISGSEIEIDDKEFMKLFEVYAPNTAYAERVLTTAFREGLKRVTKYIPGDYYISLCGDLLTVANNSGKDRLEIETPDELIENNYEMLLSFFKELYAGFILIDDLKIADNSVCETDASIG